MSWEDIIKSNTFKIQTKFGGSIGLLTSQTFNSLKEAYNAINSQARELGLYTYIWAGGEEEGYMEGNISKEPALRGFPPAVGSFSIVSVRD